jgi:hypothetical protein
VAERQWPGGGGRAPGEAAQGGGLTRRRWPGVGQRSEERVVDEEVASRVRRRHWCSGEKGNGRPGKEAALAAR